MKEAILLLALISRAMTFVPVEEEAIKELITGNHEFSAKVYKEICKFEKYNFVVSPIAAETVMAMVHEGARGKTADEFVDGLHLPYTNQKIQYAFKHFLPNLRKSQEGLKLSPANRVYIGEAIKTEESFKDLAIEIYDLDVEHIDFGNHANAAHTINTWVAHNTHNKIIDLIDTGVYNENTEVVLVNALYFSGDWVHKFHSENTTTKNFYRATGDSVEVDTMYQVEHFNYYEHPLKVQLLELPIKGGDLNMVIALPCNEVDMSTIEKHIEQLIRPQPFKKTKVAVEIPKFRTETKILFAPILENMGITKAFHEGADFSGISVVDRVRLNDVVQKTIISINEMGTEPTAVSSTVYSSLGRDAVEPIIFTANRPFMYYIVYHEVVIFTGRINDFEIEG